MIYPTWLDRVDVRVTGWMARHGLPILRISLGVVFLWFGLLKFFPGMSPAQELVAQTVSALTFGVVPPEVALPLLAAWECAVGLGLIVGQQMRAVLLLLFLQMLGTLTPLVLFPEAVFVAIPFAPTLEGQYIIKNVVLIAAAIVLGATVRGGGLVADASLADAADRADGGG